MLGLIALPSLGIVTLSRVSLGSEIQVPTEENEERLPGTVHCRTQLRRVRDIRESNALQPILRFNNALRLSRPLPVIGHRYANGLLAPIRC